MIDNNVSPIGQLTEEQQNSLSHYEIALCMMDHYELVQQCVMLQRQVIELQNAQSILIGLGLLGRIQAIDCGDGE